MFRVILLFLLCKWSDFFIFYVIVSLTLLNIQYFIFKICTCTFAEALLLPWLQGRRGEPDPRPLEGPRPQVCLCHHLRACRLRGLQVRPGDRLPIVYRKWFVFPSNGTYNQCCGAGHVSVRTCNSLKNTLTRNKHMCCFWFNYRASTITPLLSRTALSQFAICSRD